MSIRYIFKILLFLLFILIYSYGNECNNTILVTSKKCIRIDDQNYFVDSTTVDDLIEKKIIKEKPELSCGIWDGFNLATHEQAGGFFYTQQVEFNNIQFNFHSFDDTLNLKLSKVIVVLNGQNCVQILDKLVTKETYDLQELKNQANDKSIEDDRNCSYDSLQLRFQLVVYKKLKVLEIY